MWKGMSENSQRRVSRIHLDQLVKRPLVLAPKDRLDALGEAIGRESRRLRRLLDAANATKDKLNGMRRDMHSLKPQGLDNAELRSAFMDQVRASLTPEQWRELMNKAIEAAAEKRARSDDVVIVTVKKHRKRETLQPLGDGLLPQAGEQA